MDLPAPVRKLFWDTDAGALRWERHREAIIGRVLASGTWADVTWLRKAIGDPALRDWILRQLVEIGLAVLRSRLAAAEAKPIALSFGPPEQFQGHGIRLPCVASSAIPQGHSAGHRIGMRRSVSSAAEGTCICSGNCPRARQVTTMAILVRLTSRPDPFPNGWYPFVFARTCGTVKQVRL